MSKKDQYPVSRYTGLPVEDDGNGGYQLHYGYSTGAFLCGAVQYRRHWALWRSGCRFHLLRSALRALYCACRALCWGPHSHRARRMACRTRACCRFNRCALCAHGAEYVAELGQWNVWRLCDALHLRRGRACCFVRVVRFVPHP